MAKCLKILSSNVSFQKSHPYLKVVVGSFTEELFVLFFFFLRELSFITAQKEPHRLIVKMVTVTKQLLEQVLFEL